MLLRHNSIDSIDGVSNLCADRVRHEDCVEALLAVVVHELCGYTISMVHLRAVLEECGGDGFGKEVSILAHGIDAVGCVFFPRIIGNVARTIRPEVDPIRMTLLCCVCDADGVLLGEVGGEPLVNPLGRLEDRVEVGTVLGLQEGIQDVLRHVVRDEVEDIRGIRVRHLVCGFLGFKGGLCLRKKRFINFYV